MPLDQNVEQSQCEADPRLEIVPGFVGHVLEATDIGQHGENGFDDHAHIPFGCIQNELRGVERQALAEYG